MDATESSFFTGSTTLLAIERVDLNISKAFLHHIYPYVHLKIYHGIMARGSLFLGETYSQSSFHASREKDQAG